MIDLTASATPVKWRKSSKSAPQGNDCVEIAVIPARRS